MGVPRLDPHQAIGMWCRFLAYSNRNVLPNANHLRVDSPDAGDWSQKGSCEQRTAHLSIVRVIEAQLALKLGRAGAEQERSRMEFYHRRPAPSAFGLSAAGTPRLLQLAGGPDIRRDV